MSELPAAENSEREVDFHLKEDGLYCGATLIDFHGIGGEEGWGRLPRHLSKAEMQRAIQILFTCEREDFWTAFDLLKEGRLPLDGSELNFQ